MKDFFHRFKMATCLLIALFVGSTLSPVFAANTEVPLNQNTFDANSNGNTVYGTGNTFVYSNTNTIGIATENSNSNSLSYTSDNLIQGNSNQISGGASNTITGNSNTLINADSSTITGNNIRLGGSGIPPVSNAVVIGNAVTVTVDNASVLGSNSVVSATNSVALGANTIADRPNTVSVGAPGNLRQITNVADGTASTDAVNLRQLDAANATNETRTYRTGALAAALTGIMPLAYDPEARTQVGAGFGSYRGESAFAIGINHYVNESTLVNLGAAIDGSETMWRAGVTWRLGSGTTRVSGNGDYQKLQTRIQELQAQNRLQQGKNMEMQAQINQLKQMIQK